MVSGEIPAEMFAGAIVLAGPYTTGMMDAYYTAVNRNVPMYGVEIHANILQTFLDSNQKQEAGKVTGLLLTAAVMAAVLLCLSIGRIAVSLPLTFGIAAVYWAGAGYAYEQGYVLPLCTLSYAL